MVDVGDRCNGTYFHQHKPLKCHQNLFSLFVVFDEISAYILDTGIFHLSDYENAPLTTTKNFQSICKKFFDADLENKNKIVSCDIPPRVGI